MKRILRMGLWMAFCLALLMSLAVPGAWAAEEDDGNMAQRLAEAQSQISAKPAGNYGMTPIYAGDVDDGVYDILVDSSSPYFRIAKATLTVEGDTMTARITVPSMSYLYVYPGTNTEAAAAGESAWIGFEEEDHQTTFTLPVPALNAEVQCAAYSKARKRWYSRTLVFDASSLPKEALPFDLPDYELIEKAIRAYKVVGSEELKKQRLEAAKALEPVTLDMKDGEYSIEVNMTGGSGRASISSPTLLIVRDGKAYAQLIWSSVYYDYMIVDGAYFYNMTEDGGPSRFEIPITAIDEPMPVIADTTAMGDPVEIQYTLTFYAETVGDRSLIPQESAKMVLIIAGAIILIGGAANMIIKKRRKQ
ncbi:MAG: hypothetical protein K6B40_08665 [Firmicutes bacterium]|nr:hypothetical protein [Bacillota bacterium]